MTSLPNAATYITKVVKEVADSDKQITTESNNEDDARKREIIRKYGLPRNLSLDTAYPFGQPVRFLSKLMNIPAAEAYQVLKAADWNFRKLALAGFWWAAASPTEREARTITNQIDILTSQFKRSEKDIVKQMAEDPTFDTEFLNAPVPFTTPSAQRQKELGLERERKYLAQQQVFQLEQERRAQEIRQNEAKIAQSQAAYDASQRSFAQEYGYQPTQTEQPTESESESEYRRRKQLLFAKPSSDVGVVAEPVSAASPFSYSPAGLMGPVPNSPAASYQAQAGPYSTPSSYQSQVSPYPTPSSFSYSPAASFLAPASPYSAPSASSSSQYPSQSTIPPYIFPVQRSQLSAQQLSQLSTPQSPAGFIDFRGGTQGRRSRKSRKHNRY